MRAAVITLNILSAVLGLLCVPFIRIFGALGVLATAHGRTGDTVLGLVIATTPVAVPLSSFLWSQHLLRRSRPLSILIAALPMIIACALMASRYVLAARYT